MATGNPTPHIITIDLILDRLTTKDVLKGVLHSIMFHRLFGLVKPRTFEVLDVTMPGIYHTETEQLMNEKVEAFWKAIEGGYTKRGQITVTISEKRSKKQWFNFQAVEENVPWEQWIINAELRQPSADKDRQALNARIADTLTQALHTMLTHTSSEHGRAIVPLITNATTISPFPIDITVVAGGREVG